MARKPGEHRRTRRRTGARRASRTAGGEPAMGEVSPIATPLTETEVRAQLEQLDVDAPRVGIVMGSESDMETMQKAAAELQAREIMHELRVMSAHREPD